VTAGPARLELWGLENRRASMEKAMGRRLSFEVEPASGNEPADGDQAANGDQAEDS